MNAWMDRHFTALLVSYVVVSVCVFASLLGVP
jgi:hypothetical protein